MLRFPGPRCLYRTALSSRTKKYPFRSFSNIYIGGKARLAGRNSLVGGEGPQMPKTLAQPKDNFPHVFDVANPKHGFQSAKLSDVAMWGGEMEQHLNSLIDKYGAVLIRGLPIDGGLEFASLVNSFAAKPMQYIGGSGVRKNIHKGVDTASDEPPSFTIEPHNEMSYSTEYPKQILFFCERPAEKGKGGETVIADVRDIYHDLDKTLIQKLVDLGVRYQWYTPSKHGAHYKSWQDMYCTERKEDVESHLMKQGYSFEWKGDDLKVWYNRPAMKKHNTTGELIWFNQAVCLHSSYTRKFFTEMFKDRTDEQLPFHTYYGDGSSIEPEVVQHIRDVTWKACVGYQMKKNDVVAVDNMYVQHARLCYEGERRLLVSLLQF